MVKTMWMDDYKVYTVKGWHIIVPGAEMREHWRLRDMQARAFDGMKVHECQSVPINHQKDTFWKGYLP